MWLTALDDAWRVLAAGLLLGAGLPILFALGVKSLAWANGELWLSHTGSRKLHRARLQ